LLYASCLSSCCFCENHLDFSAVQLRQNKIGIIQRICTSNTLFSEDGKEYCMDFAIFSARIFTGNPAQPWAEGIGHGAESGRQMAEVRERKTDDRFQPSRRPNKRPVKSKKKLMNIEHRTSNIERRMNVYCLF
jgi:hypothetical protein